MRGKFIVFEGIDGCGKTTQLELLERYLENNCEWTISTKEPWNGDKKTFKWIRKILDKEIVIEDRAILEMLFWNNTYEHCKWINKVLDMGVNVLCDRYWYSSIAYQELFEEDFIVRINSKMLVPDKIVYVNTSGKEAMKRINKRGEKTTLYEFVEKLESANKRYEEFFSKQDNVLVLNGLEPIDSLHEIVIENMEC